MRAKYFVGYPPWNHRANISAQAYLKPSKMGKINITELFRLNSLWIILRWFRKKYSIFFEIFGSNITGSWFFEVFRRSFTTEKIISKLNIKYKVFRKVFFAWKTLNIKIYPYLGTYIFFGSGISKFSILGGGRRKMRL
jgi:hypothetical protein